MPIGRLEVIYGCMFSGKSEELLGRLHLADIAGVKSHLFKPSIDDRYEGVHKVNSHSGKSRDAVPIDCARQILELVRPDIRIVGIEEAQFLDSEIVSVCNTLVLQGKRVIVAGLSLDFRGEPFGSMPNLIAAADEALMRKAICKECGEDVPNATRTQRMVNGKPAHYSDPLIVIGAKNSYEARCLFHHEVPGKE
jgi:thymidine kinase